MGAARPRVRRGGGLDPRRRVELGAGRRGPGVGRPQRGRGPGGPGPARRVRPGPWSRRGRGPGGGDCAHVPHRRRAGRHGGAAGRRHRPPGEGRRRGHALRFGPLGARLHAAAAGRLDTRGARLRRLFRLRPAAHGGRRHAAVDAERRADQLHRGHVLCPRVGHGEDAEFGAPGRRGGSGAGQGHRGSDELRSARGGLHRVGHCGETGRRGAPVRAARGRPAPRRRRRYLRGRRVCAAPARTRAEEDGADGDPE